MAASSIQHPALAFFLSVGSVQALAPTPGELPTANSPHRSRLTRSTQAADHQDQGESCRGFGRIRLRCAIRRFYLFVGGFGRPRALHGHSPRASAGRSGRRHFGGSGRAQLRQVSCQRTACASSPHLNLSCTQAMAEVRPFARRSRPGAQVSALLICFAVEFMHAG